MSCFPTVEGTVIVAPVAIVNAFKYLDGLPLYGAFNVFPVPVITRMLVPPVTAPAVPLQSKFPEQVIVDDPRLIVSLAP